MRWITSTICASTFAVHLFGLMTADDNRIACARDGAAISGVVTFDGPRPERKQLQLREKDGGLSDCHKLHGQGLLDENLLVSKKGELGNVFVYVKKGVEKKSYPAPKEPAVLNQVGCMFRPRVQGVMIGQAFVMKNGDPVLHNVRTLSFRNRPFNVAQTAKSPDRTKVFTKKEKAVTILCDLHPWMKAFCFVMDHPWFAVTSTNGQFRIEGLPDGKYTLAAWHEELGEQELVVTVTAIDSSKVEFSFKPKKSNVVVPKVTFRSSGNAPNTTSTDPNETVPRPFVRKWKVKDLMTDTTDFAARSIELGRDVFNAAGCIKCHVIAGKGAKYGPDLTDVVKRFTGAKLLQQLVSPSSEIHKDFQTQMFLTTGGRVVSGLVVKDEAEMIHVLPNPLKPDEIEIVKKSSIEDHRNSEVSTMPEGLLDTFNRNEIMDLLEFLKNGGVATP